MDIYELKVGDVVKNVCDIYVNPYGGIFTDYWRDDTIYQAGDLWIVEKIAYNGTYLVHMSGKKCVLPAYRLKSYFEKIDG